MSSDVSSRVSSLRTDYPPRGRPLRILAPAARARLDRLAASGLSDFDFDRILGALETNVTSLSLEALATQLRSTSRALQSRPGFRTVAGELTAAADDVSSLHRDVVGPMLERTKELNVSLSSHSSSLCTRPKTYLTTDTISLSENGFRTTRRPPIQRVLAKGGHPVVREGHQRGGAVLEHSGARPRPERQYHTYLSPLGGQGSSSSLVMVRSSFPADA